MAMDAREQKKFLLPFIQVRPQHADAPLTAAAATGGAEPGWPQRAEEVEKVDKKIAYYCRLHAVTQVPTHGLRLRAGRCLSNRLSVQGAEIPNLMEPMRGVVLALMSKLERDKGALELNAAEDPAYCEAFAVNIFNRANRVDRAGQANDSTAKTFYVASIFIDVRTQACLLSCPASLQGRQAACDSCHGCL